MFDIVGFISSFFSGGSSRRKSEPRISSPTGSEAERVHRATYKGIEHDAALRRAASSAPKSTGGASRTSSKTPAGIAHDAALRRAASSSSTRTQSRTSTPSKPAPSKPAASHSRPTKVSYTVSAPTRHPAQKPEPKPQPKPQTSSTPSRPATQAKPSKKEQANKEFRKLISQGKSPGEAARIIEQKYGASVQTKKAQVEGIAPTITTRAEEAKPEKKNVIQQAWEGYEKGLTRIATAFEREADKHLAFERYEPTLREGTVPQHLFMEWKPQPGQPKKPSEMIAKHHEKELKEYETAAEKYNAIVEKYRQRGPD